MEFAGPFMSGSTHAVLHLGQRPLTDIASEEENSEAPPQRKWVSGEGMGKAGVSVSVSTVSRRGRGAVTLHDLITAALLVPGKGKLAVLYKGATTTATLSRNGNILYQGVKYHSATSFSIHVKRQQTPGKQGDDGWKSVLYEGRPLEHYRRLYHVAADAGGGARAALATLHGTGLEDDEMEEFDSGAVAGGGGVKPGGGGGGGGGTDQWVQCDRCRSWRIVPESAWAHVEADDRDVWFCSDATWMLTTTSPFTPACTESGLAEAA